MTFTAWLAGQSNARNYTVPELEAAYLGPGWSAWTQVTQGNTGLTTHWLKGSGLYNLLKSSILAAEPKTRRLIWWIQGENDCVDGNHAVYGANMIQMAADLEADVGALLWWIDCSLSNNATSLGANRTTVNNGKSAFVAQHPRAALVNTDGLEFESDALHYTAAGRAALTTRMLAAKAGLGI